jgi:hypothetical protein
MRRSCPGADRRQMVQQRGEPFLFPFLCCLAHTANPWDTRSPALCRAACWSCRCSPWSAPFPPQPPPSGRLLLLLCSAGSSVLRRSPTPPLRACRRAALRLRRPACDPDWIRRWRSPGSRACCFSACAGSRLRRADRTTRAIAGCRVAFPLCPQGRHPDQAFFEAQYPAH